MIGAPLEASALGSFCCLPHMERKKERKKERKIGPL